MKKLLLILIIAFPIFVGAQNQINLKNGKAFVGVIKRVKDNNIQFWDKIPATDVRNVDINEVVSIMGQVDDSYVDRLTKANSQVVFFERRVTRKDYKEQYIVEITDAIARTGFSGIQILISSNQPTSGDLIQLAGTRYLTGISLGVGGSVLAIIGAGQTNNTMANVGYGAMLGGVIIGITGHFKLIEAGKAMNREAITMSAAENGIGIAINF